MMIGRTRRLYLSLVSDNIAAVETLGTNLGSSLPLHCRVKQLFGVGLAVSKGGRRSPGFTIHLGGGA